MREAELESGVGGLICRQCEDLFKNRLAYVRGVIGVECSYFRGRAKVRYDADLLSEEELRQHMGQAGFPATERNGRGLLYDLLSVVAIALLLVLLRTVDLPALPKADNGTSYAGLFLIGLVSGTHCMVMCGGIMLSQTAERMLGEARTCMTGRRLASVLSYNAGRVIMASVLGALFGAVGSAVIFSMKAKSMVFTMTGLYILLIGLGIWGVPALRRIQGGIPTLCEARRKSPAARRAGPFVAGALTALLPCAASNGMWMLAVSAGGAAEGLATMLAWALGTVPCMVAFGMFACLLGARGQAWMIRANVVLLVTLGLNMAAMGLGMLG